MTRNHSKATVARLLVTALACLILAACGARVPAPWDDRSHPRPPDTRSTPPRVTPVPDAHVVQRGESLYSIAFRYGLDWRELAYWNGIDPPYVIRPGQAVRLGPTRTGTPAVARTAPAPRPQPDTRETPPEIRPAPTPEAETSPADDPAHAPAQLPQPAPAGDATRAPAPIADAAERTVADVRWRWPTQGRITRRFDPNDTRKGVAIAGTRGQPVLAAADGQVVYSGTGLIGYGELIIIKHSDSMLSAYGHNHRRLVAEGERVRAGQQIAELGLNERNEEILHFEIRRNGQPEDPLRYLPNRGG